MKKITTILAILLYSLTLNAQIPQKMTYQAVIRDANDRLISNKTIGIKISILKGVTVVYSEVYNPNPTTNRNGLVTLEIGGGTALLGDFSAIDWADGPYFIKTEIDPNGGSSFSITGTSQLLSVPYAFYARTAGPVSENDPVFRASPAKNISDEDITNWNNKDDSNTNELQTLSINGNQLSISEGNSVVLPTGEGGDQWGAQVVASDETLTGDGTSGNPLGINLDAEAFNNWDKDESDDFSGDFNDLTNKPVTFFEVGGTNPPNDIGDDMYHIGNIIIGDTITNNIGNRNINLSVINNASTSYDYSIYSKIDASDNTYGSNINLKNEIISNGSLHWSNLSTYNIKNTIKHTNDGVLYSILNEISSRDSGSTIITGMLQRISSTNSITIAGIVNDIIQNNTCRITGVVNELRSNGSSKLTGTSNKLSSEGDADCFGSVNSLLSTGDGLYIGVKNLITNSGDGYHYGIYDSLSSDGSGNQFGVYTIIDNSGNGSHYGLYSRLAGSGYGSKYGVYSTIDDNDNGNHYGLYSHLAGSGRGSKYGIYSTIDNNDDGNHYAVFGEVTSGEVTKSGLYAGYFKGDVYVSKKLKGDHSGNTDMKAYIYGLISSSGSVNTKGSSTGFSCSRTSTGVYNITFNNSPGNSSSYITVVTPYSSSEARIATVTQGTNSFLVYIRNLDGRSVNSTFNFVVFKK